MVIRSWVMVIGGTGMSYRLLKWRLAQIDIMLAHFELIVGKSKGTCA